MIIFKCLFSVYLNYYKWSTILSCSNETFFIIFPFLYMFHNNSFGKNNFFKAIADNSNLWIMNEKPLLLLFGWQKNFEINQSEGRSSFIQTAFYIPKCNAYMYNKKRTAFIIFHRTCEAFREPDCGGTGGGPRGVGVAGLHTVWLQ